MRVLVVDDSPTMQDIICSTLRAANYEVVQAEHGVEALECLKTMTPDLIITDLNMYQMDGFEFVSRVREDASHEFTPILFLTTEGAEDFKQIGRDLGATGWMLKPFEPKELLRVVKSILQ
jgi:two-component system, chemotaxis family, chemotaxis protein CheY